jgi:hypothetical protein
MSPLLALVFIACSMYLITHGFVYIGGICLILLLTALIVSIFT